MPLAHLNRARSGAARAFDAEVLAWRDAVVTNGGSVSLARLVTVDQFVFNEKAAGCWALTDDYLVHWAENEIQALTSLKQRRLATAVNAPGFTVDRGYTFDGVSNYVDASFIASSHAVVMTVNNIRVAVYERTNASGNSSAVGVNSNSSRQLAIRPRNGTTASGFAGTSVATFTLPGPDSRGFTAVSRATASLTDTLSFKNGAGLVRSADPAGAGTVLPNNSILVGALNSAGTPGNFRGSTIGMTCWGAALSSPQEISQYSNVQDWATAVGANV